MNFWNFLNMRYCIVHVAIIIFWIIKILSFDLSHLYIHKHTCSRAHTHTHTRMHTYRHIHTRMHIQKSTVLMKTSDLIKIEIERNETKIFPLPKQNDWKCKMKKFIFSEVFQRFCLDLNGCIRVLVYSDLLLQILLIRKQPFEILVKSWKISYEEFHS